jgi:transcriptional regulator with XRE-family HTH domain
MSAWWRTQAAAEWIRESRERLYLTQAEFADRIREVEGGGVDDRLVRRWESGENCPRPHYRRAICQVAGEPAWDQVPNQGSAHPGILTEVDRREFLRSAGLIGVGTALSELHPWQLERLIRAVARESAQEASHAELTNVGPATLEQLHADVRRLARSYVTEPVLPLFVEMVAIRDHVFNHLSGRQPPSQTIDLHLLAGQLCGLLANATLDLGYKEAAADHARSAWAYAEVIGHEGVRAWVRYMQAVISYWSGHPSDALNFARSGQSHATSGTVLARLSAWEAQALAWLGFRDDAARAINRAQSALGTGYDELHDDVQGEFAYGPARLAAASTSVFMHTGETQRALEAADQALALFRSSPPEERSYGCEALLLINLATTHVHRRELEGATSVLTPVLSLPSAHQIELYGQGLGRIRKLLNQPDYRQASAAKQLDQRIQNFYLESVWQGLAV